MLLLCKLNGIKRAGDVPAGVGKKIQLSTWENRGKSASLSLKVPTTPSESSRLCDKVVNSNVLPQLKRHSDRTGGKRFASGQASQVKRGLSRTSRAILVVSGVLSAGYLAVRLTVNFEEPAKPYQLCGLTVILLLRDREVRGSIPGRVKPRTLSLVLVADPPGVWHYGFSVKSGQPVVRIM
ncbi:hypothetical protein ElyMa_006554700 [Elysia marginata]|uniref:Uncharacterized protein n=1 Tax=Elysia marginata TaxID=1093978 RepID=A0AAV4I9A5_9GAST|nr:hypothetical protein ElyMa_006554700 [Elysia marginata]